MSRVSSLNREIEIDGRTIHPLSIGEYSTIGEEERIDVIDGQNKYKTGSQIWTTDEIQITINITQDKHDLKIMEEWAKSGETRDVYVISRNAKDEAVFTDLFSNCGCSMGKRNAFDRASKEGDKKNYFLTPEAIEEVK